MSFFVSNYIFFALFFASGDTIETNTNSIDKIANAKSLLQVYYLKGEILDAKKKMTSEDRYKYWMDLLQKNDSDNNKEQSLSLLLLEAFMYESYDLYNESITTYQKVLVGLPSHEIDCYNLILNNLAKIHYEHHNYDEMNRSLEGFYITKGIQPKTIADINNFKAVVSNDFGEYEQAIELLDSCIKINRGLEDSISLGENFTNKGYAYYLQGEFGSAEKYYKKAFSYAKKENEDTYTLRGLNLARAYIKLRKIDKAKSLYAELIQLNSSPKYKALANYHYYWCKKTFLRTLTDKSCLEYLDTAIHYAKIDNDLNLIVDLYRCYSEEYYKRNELKKAYDNLYYCIVYEDSIDVKRKKILSEKKEIFNYYEKQTAKEEFRLNEQVKEMNLYILVMGFSILILCLFIIWMILHMYKKNKKIISQEINIEKVEHDYSIRLNRLYKSQKGIKTLLLKYVHTLSEIDKNLNNALICTSKLPLNKNESVINEIRSVRRLIKTLKESNIYIQEDSFKMKEILMEMYPTLTQTEINLCVLISLGYSTYQIAAFNSISKKSVEVSRYRVRKKMEIESNDKLIEILQNLCR